MAIAQMERTDGPDAQVAIFVDACWSVWAHAQWIVVYRVKGKPVQIAKSGVVLVTDKDGKLENDVAQTVDHFVRIAKADAERQGGSGCDYKFELWGPRELSNNRRKVVAPPEELHGQRIRFGDAEDLITADASVLRESAGLLRANAAATHDLLLGAGTNATGYEKLISMQQSMLTTALQRDEQHSTERVATAGIQLEIKKLEFNFEVQKETWRREDEKEKRVLDGLAAEQQHERSLQEKRNDMLLKMGEKAMENPEVMTSVAYVVRSFGDLLQAGASLLKKGQQAAGMPTDAPADTPPPGAIGPRLAELLGKLKPEGLVALEAALTQDVYDRIKAASTKTDDTEARAILAPIQDLWMPQDRLVLGDDGKPDASRSKVWSEAEKKKAAARKVHALNGAAQIFEHHMPAFVRALEDAGLKLR